MRLRWRSLAGAAAAWAVTWGSPSLTSAQSSCASYQTPVMLAPGTEGCHQQHLTAVAAAKAGAIPDLVLYGDSIFEIWHGTDVCASLGAASGAAASFQQSFGQLKTLVLAITGDTSGNLLWRVQNGEVLAARAAALYIGGNDLVWLNNLCGGQADGITAAAAGIVSRIKEIAAALRAASSSQHIFLMGLWPHGLPGETQWPNRFTGAMNSVNTQLQAYANEHPNMSYVYCGGPFVENGRLVHFAGDELHPDGTGFAMTAQCLAAAVNPVLGAGGQGQGTGQGGAPPGGGQGGNPSPSPQSQARPAPN